MINKKLLSERIKTLRNQRNLSMADIAKALEISNVSVFQWESMKSLPTSDKLLALADYFNVPLDYLVGRDVGTDCPLPAVTPDELAIIEKLRALSPEKRQIVESLLNQL